MQALRQNAADWLAALPQKIASLRGGANSIGDPLFR
jgi:hypothetical protein